MSRYADVAEELRSGLQFWYNIQDMPLCGATGENDAD